MLGDRKITSSWWATAKGIGILTEKDSPDLAWRAEMLAEVEGEDLARATDALLSLAYHEPDREWIEATLLNVIDDARDLQIRALAVVCIGHVARIHRAITKERVVPKLRELERDPDLRSRALNAIEDIEVFTGK